MDGAVGAVAGKWRERKSNQRRVPLYNLICGVMSLWATHSSRLVIEIPSPLTIVSVESNAKKRPERNIMQKRKRKFIYNLHGVKLT